LLINNRGGTTVKEGGNFGEGEKQTIDSRGEYVEKKERKKRAVTEETERERQRIVWERNKVTETERRGRATTAGCRDTNRSTNTAALPMP
jgi:hypothetical protein